MVRPLPDERQLGPVTSSGGDNSRFRALIAICRGMTREIAIKASQGRMRASLLQHASLSIHLGRIQFDLSGVSAVIATVNRNKASYVHEAIMIAKSFRTHPG
jgi:hypothetical protein